jgi:hypothetical protein
MEGNSVESSRTDRTTTGAAQQRRVISQKQLGGGVIRIKRWETLDRREIYAKLSLYRSKIEVSCADRHQGKVTLYR